MLEVIPRLVAEGIVCDAACTDPPYHLAPMHKRFGQAFSAPPGTGRDGSFRRLSGGFMGQQWDGGDIAFRPETWATVATILRPGAFLVAFGGTRTYHRLVCAIEDAGFIIQDSILDLIASDARVQRFLGTLSPGQVDAFSQILDELQPTGALAWAFASGFPKRRDMLKAAFEPIVLAYKPGGKRTLQVDECRIATDRRPLREIDPKETAANVYTGRVRGDASFAGGSKAVGSTDIGRWPANVVTDGGDEVLAAFPTAPGAFAPVRGTEPSASTDGIYGKFSARSTSNRREGEASAARRYTDESGFGMLPGARRSDGGSAARFYFSAKADAQDRWGSRHPTVKPVELMKWLIPLVTPAGGLVLDPFAGSGTSGVAALATGRDCILIEREDTYIADIRERLAFYEGGGMHSTAAKNRNRKRDEGPLFGA